VCVCMGRLCGSVVCGSVFFGPIGPGARAAGIPPPGLWKTPPKYSLNTDIFSEVKDSYVDTVRSTIYRMDSEDVSWVDYEVSPKLDRAFCTYEEFLGRRIVSKSLPPSTNEVPNGGDKRLSPRGNGLEVQVDEDQFNGITGESEFHSGNVSPPPREFEKDILVTEVTWLAGKTLVGRFNGKRAGEACTQQVDGTTMETMF
jgi:hypothetical protein